jgi:hypothetical protein
MLFLNSFEKPTPGRNLWDRSCFRHFASKYYARIAAGLIPTPEDIEDKF